MAGDNHVGIGARIDVQRLQVVQNVDSRPREAHEFRVGVFASPLGAVHVSSDRSDGRNPAKRLNDLGPPDVAGGMLAAQLTGDYVEAGGILLPTRRRAYVRGPDNRPVLDLLMVSIDISNVRLA